MCRCGQAPAIDDKAVTGLTIQDVLNITGSFATVAGQVLNASACHVWATWPEEAHEPAVMHVLDEGAPSIRGGRPLGAFLRFGKHLHNDLAEKCTHEARSNCC